MKILLIYPYYPYASVTTFEEPVGILYLASALMRAGHEVRAMDLTFERNLKVIESSVLWAECVGVSSPSPLFGTAASILKRVKSVKPGIPVIIGGPHATADTHDALASGFDIAVVGEGEAAVVELAEALSERGPLESVSGIAFKDESGDSRFTKPRPFIEDLDSIAFPERRFIDYSRYRRLGVISMRGCPYRCIYCKPVEEKLFGQKLRKRSLENVVEEVAYLISRYGSRQISFKDDTLTVNRTEWFEGLGERMEKRGIRLSWQCSSRVDTIDIDKLRAMKRAGCRQIFFGIESGSQRILDYYRKDITVEQIERAFEMCRRAGVRACASIMLGAPFETTEDLEKTYRLVKRIRPFNWHVHVTTPMCGSYLYDQAKAEGRIEAKSDYSSFEPTGNLYRLHLPMKLDFLKASDLSAYREKINRMMKMRLLISCLLDPAFWAELAQSRGLRIIALNFLRRHFKLKGDDAA